MNLKEIAKAANVSPSTVSFVLNNTGQVGEETRKRVSALLIENGYTVSPYYRNKITKDFRFIKFSSHSLLVQENTGFVSDIIDAIYKETKRMGYTLQMSTANRDTIAQTAETVKGDESDGIILLGTELEEQDVKYFDQVNKPIVVVDNHMSMLNYNSVDMNNYESVKLSIDHLVELGHREIGYIYNKIPSSNCIARINAYRQIMTDMGLPFSEKNIFRVRPTLSTAYEDTLAMLKDGVKFPKAVLATNDSMAIGAIKAFKEYGLKVPEDISIVGFDDIAFSTIVEPALTTVKVPCADIGVWAVRLLSDRVNYPDAAVAKIEVSAKLVVRESTCKA